MVLVSRLVMVRFGSTCVESARARLAPWLGVAICGSVVGFLPCICGWGDCWGRVVLDGEEVWRGMFLVRGAYS